MLSLNNIQDLIKKEIEGQDEAVDELTIALYKYLLKLQAKDFGYFFNSSSTILLTGSTGIGKTYLCRLLADNTNLPFIEINAKSISQEGWSGKSFERLIAEQFPTNRNCGIIFIDEFDKMLCPLGSDQSDNVNYHLQASLLKYIESGTLNLNKLGYPLSYKELNTCNLLFIFAGAFVGLDLEAEKNIGFKTKDIIKPLMTDALIKFGMIPELAGRIQQITSLKDITKEGYTKIIDADYFILNKYLEMLTKFGICAIVNKDLLIENALKKKLGVRGLIQETERIITEIIKENKELIDFEKLSPLYTPKNKPENNI